MPIRARCGALRDGSLAFLNIIAPIPIDILHGLRHNRVMVPVVLHHGIMGFDFLKVGPFKINYFGGGIASDIAKRGHPVIVPKVAFTGSILARVAGHIENGTTRPMGQSNCRS